MSRPSSHSAAVAPATAVSVEPVGRSSRRRWLQHTGSALAAGAAWSAGAAGAAPGGATSGGTAAASVVPAAAALLPAYQVTTQGKVAGHLRCQWTASRLSVDFSFRENGRGPDLKESIEVDGQGRAVRYEGAGVSTFGAAIGESFEFTDEGRIRWTSRVDRGDEAAPAGARFMPLESSPAYLGLLAWGVRQAQAAGAPSVPLVGSGVGLKAQVVQRLTLPDETAPGASVALELWALEGLDVAPLWAWMRAGPTPQFYGVVEGIFAVLPPGQAAQAPVLVKAQAEAQEQRLAQLQAQLTQSLPGLTCIAGVRWFDAPRLRLEGPSDVWLLDGRIRAITAPGAWTVNPERRIDGAGRTLIPGLIDMHAHVLRSDLLLNLAFGVTTVRDMGNDNADLMRQRAALDQGRLLGPRVVPLGFIEGASPFAASGGITAKTLPEALAAVDWYHARGIRQLKLYNSIKPEWVVPIVRHAKAKGLKVGGHVPAFMKAAEVVRSGFDEISHINQLMLNFVVRQGDDTRTLQRFTRVGDDAHAVVLQSPQAQAFLTLLGQRRTVVDPTLVAFEAMYTQQQGEFNPSYADVQDHVPATWRRRFRVAELDIVGPTLKTYRGSWKQLLALTGALHKAGAVVVPGTDSISGLGLHRELALLVQAGLTPAEALRSATSVSAQVCGIADITGRIAPGLAADLLLIDGNPLEDLSALRRTRLVIKGSMALDPSAAQAALGFKPFVASAPV